MKGWIAKKKKKNGAGEDIGGYLLDDGDNDSQHPADREERGLANPTY